MCLLGGHLGMLLQKVGQGECGGCLLAHAEGQCGQASLEQEAGMRVQHPPVDHNLVPHLPSM